MERLKNTLMVWGLLLTAGHALLEAIRNGIRDASDEYPFTYTLGAAAGGAVLVLVIVL